MVRARAALAVLLAACLAGCAASARPVPLPTSSAGPSFAPAAIAAPSPARTSAGSSTEPIAAPEPAAPASSAPTAPPVRPQPSPPPVAPSTPAPTARTARSAPAGLAPAPLAWHGDRATKTIALTIDDCFSPTAVWADLMILEAEHVNATWFPIGREVERSPELWRTVAANDFPVANHTLTHPILTHLDYAQVLAEVRDDNETVGRIIGEPLLPILRPPGGEYDDTVLAAAEAAGERLVVTWDTVDGDTVQPYDDVAHLVREAEQGRNGSILLMHANLPYTQQALPAIIAWYRARGFTFVTLGQMFGIPSPVPFPASAPVANGPAASTPALPSPTAPVMPVPSLEPGRTAEPSPAATGSETAERWANPPADGDRA